MELALYHPVHGYYADPSSREVGRKGDFYTSVSVGDTFGTILSHKIEEEWEKSFGSPENFVIVEQGAHDGRLARDILNSLEKRDSPLLSGLEYRIVEPRESVRNSLNDLTGLNGRLHPVASFAEASSECGIFLCNELLDAFPVRRFVVRDRQWRELNVGREDEGGLCYVESDIDPADPVISILPDGEFSQGYETELCPAVKDWVREASRLFQRGKWWIIDYGHESDDYFAASRNDGTLRCYQNHRATENPFEAVGQTDITAHVNFTHLQKWAEEAGLRAQLLTDQHHFLTHAARPWLLGMEGQPPNAETAKQIRQFQTLTHPSLMGQQFKVAEFSNSLPDPIGGE